MLLYFQEKKVYVLEVSFVGKGLEILDLCVTVPVAADDRKCVLQNKRLDNETREEDVSEGVMMYVCIEMMEKASKIVCEH